MWQRSCCPSSRRNWLAPFSYSKRPRLHPHCCRVTPQRELLLVLQTFAPFPPPSIQSIHLYPSFSNSTCSFSFTAVVLGVQRSFCPGGAATWPRLQSRVHSTSSHGHQHRGRMKGSSLERQQNGSRKERSFIRCILLKIFFFSAQTLCRSRIYVPLFP